MYLLLYEIDHQYIDRDSDHYVPCLYNVVLFLLDVFMNIAFMAVGFSLECCSLQLARIMAILQQQRQQQGGVGGAAQGGGSSKLSPSHLGGGLSKQAMVDPLTHPGLGGPLSDPYAKSQGMYPGECSCVLPIQPK